MNMQSPFDGHETTYMPSTRTLDPRRLRTAGILSESEKSWCRAQGVAIGFDPVQQGWVTLECDDDITPVADARTASVQPLGSSAAVYRLRPWHDGDAARLAELLSQPRIWRYLPEDAPDAMSEETARDLIAIVNETSHQTVRAIEYAGVVIGQVRIVHEVGETTRTSGEISYWLGEEWWGKGIGTRVVAEFAEACLDAEPELETLTARVHRDNPASARILEKAGFRPDAERAEHPDWRFFSRPRMAEIEMSRSA